jgi:hypothetical protein
MKKSQLIKLIKEEVTKMLQEAERDKLQISITAPDLVKLGVPANIATKAAQAVNKLRNPKGTIEDQPLDRGDYESLGKVFVKLLATDENNELNAFLNKIKAAKTTTTDVSKS